MILKKPSCPRKTRNKLTYCVGRAVPAFYRALNCLDALARTARPTPVPAKNENPVFEYLRAFRGRTVVSRMILPQASVVYV